MKYLSVCAGIEAATVAWHPLGWEAVGFSEIEKFPSAVLAHHYPDVPNYGDMTDHENWEGICDCVSTKRRPEQPRHQRESGSCIHHSSQPHERPRSGDSDTAGDRNCERCKRPIIDVLVGGTPCQSFSVAGLRAGMADPRGNLALVYLAIAEQYRPRWLVWENVPGVLSSNGGRDFGSIVGGMVELGYCPSWRVLDAQYFGVPQRRRRVFIVASSRDWRDSAKVLFEPESLLRNPAPRRGTGQEVAGTLASRTSAGGGLGTDLELDGGLIPDVVGALSDGAHCGGGLNGQDAYSGRIIPVVGDLTAKGPEGLGAPEVDGGHYIAHSQVVADPLVAKEASTYTHEGSNNFRTRNVTAFAQNQRDEVRLMDKAGALAAEPGAKQQTYVAQIAAPLSAANNANSNAAGRRREDDVNLAVNQDMAVRRLTPTECERLQGFPDGYTDIPGASDSGRYKALGNSMAVPVMRWIGQRIAAVGDTE